MKKYIKGLILQLFSRLIQRKTKLNRIQSEELAACLWPALISMNGWSIRKNRRMLRLLLDRIDWKQFNLTEELFQRELPHMTHVPKYREPIGAWFSIDSEKNYLDAPRVQNSDRITYYASGREPFLAIANQIQSGNKTVLIPYFACVTIAQPFLENGWQVVNYKVSKDMKINCDDLLALYEKHRPSMVIFLEYSGMDFTQEELQAIGRLKGAGCVTVVDRTQNIYSERYSEDVDFYAGSLRKWFCCPDGAYLEKNGDVPLPPAPHSGVHNDAYATACAGMMFTAFLGEKEKIGEYLALSKFFRRISASYVCEQQVRERNMSEYSKAVYLQEREKADIYSRRRKENLGYIFRRIESFSAVRPVTSDFSRFSSAPLYFNVYAKDRGELSRHLRKRGITAWYNWPKPYYQGELDEETAYIFQHILSLPCDQRYTEEDMEVLCAALEEYEAMHQERDKTAAC